jgi:hypothetical protein
MTSWLPELAKFRAWRPRLVYILAAQVLCLVLQWATIRSAPLTFSKANGAGWYALCVGLKNP